MKIKNTTFFFLSIIFLFFSSPSKAQKFSDPVAYLTYLDNEYNSIVSGLWQYTSTMAHSKSAKKVEKKRTELINIVASSKNKVSKLEPYKDDAALRDSVYSFLSICYDVLNEDYSKIVDMEAIAEQSYDLMEAYLLAQEKASEKLDVAGQRMSEEQKNFAKKFDINLVDGGSNKISKNLAIANEVMDYYNKLYLIFFKSYKQEAYLLDAIAKNDVNGIEQNKASLIKFSKEGLDAFIAAGAFKNDNSLAVSGQNMLEFYQDETTNQVPGIVNFVMVNEKFVKIKAAFEAIKEKDRTQTDVDTYNNAINEVNQAGKEYNAVNAKMNEKRTKLLNNWNSAVQSFLDKHIPKG